MVTVYSSFPSDTYVTPCSPECATAIDEYLEERTSRADEVLKADSPLIRNLYDIKKRAVKPFTKPGVLYLVNRIVKESGIKSAFQFKGEAKRALGFRKFYKTQAEESGMKSINVEVAHGHSIGVSGHYYRPKPSEILQDYMNHAADALTIDQTKRLKKQIKDLQDKHSEEWGVLKEEMNELKRLLHGVGGLSSKKEELQRRMNNRMQGDISDEL